MGVAVAGLTSDARALATYMRVECLNYRFSHGAPMLTGRLVGQVADKHQKRTMASWKRPYGVGLLIAGYVCPSLSLFRALLKHNKQTSSCVPLTRRLV